MKTMPHDLLVQMAYRLTATGLAEQAWNRGSRRFPPKFEH